MKRFIILLFILLGCNGARLYAQSEGLPQAYGIVLGGGLAIPHVEGNRNDFFNNNGNRLGYNLMTEGRYYFAPQFALGLQYSYLRTAHLPDKMHMHYVCPEIIFRPLFNNGRQGAFLSLGIGYMDYQERTYQRGSKNGHSYQKGYCGLSFGVGYEFSIAGKLSGMLRADVQTADWFVNPDGRLFNPDGYDDGRNHNWFKNNISFINIGFAIQIGQ